MIRFSRGLWVALLCGSSAAVGQTLLEQDLAYGLNLHSRIVGSAPLIERGEAYDRLQRIFGQLAQTEMAHGGGNISPQLFYLRSDEANAFATACGRMYVTDGLVSVLEGDPRLLAFVMGHEMAHNVYQHGIRKLIRSIERQNTINAIQYRIANGDKVANWEMIGFVATDRIASPKIERDEELQADQLGLFISAQAGYHPASAIIAARAMRERLGDQSKFGAFFSDHPRWATREEHAEENYAEGVRVFESRWGSGTDSPGGLPPLLISTGQLKSTRVASAWDLKVPVSIRNQSGPPISLRATEVDQHDSALEINIEPYPMDNGLSVAALHISNRDLKGRKGPQFIRIEAFQGGQRIYESPLMKFK
jgi:Zn-dependent protease with chaperone function